MQGVKVHVCIVWCQAQLIFGRAVKFANPYAQAHILLSIIATGVGEVQLYTLQRVGHCSRVPLRDLSARSVFEGCFGCAVIIGKKVGENSGSLHQIIAGYGLEAGTTHLTGIIERIAQPETEFVVCVVRGVVQAREQ